MSTEAPTSDQSVVAITTPEALRRFVKEYLCSHDHLDPKQTPLYQARLERGGKLCGLLFHVEGPRLLRTSAIWATEDHCIIFYDSTGQRFGEVKLSESPERLQ
ncbi:MAG: hypothetical protein R3B84_22765 [Zavarzinella sp.]